MPSATQRTTKAATPRAATAATAARPDRMPTSCAPHGTAVMRARTQIAACTPATGACTSITPALCMRLTGTALQYLITAPCGDGELLDGDRSYRVILGEGRRRIN